MISHDVTTRDGLFRFSIVLILLVTALVFAPVLNNDFTNWDDPTYLKENTLIRDLSLGSIKKIFTNHLDGRYHPLTLLTYAAEYHWFGLTPRVYHLDNLLLHLANVALVFALTMVMFREPTLSLITTILFAVHPLQAEPVAWIAGRKDVLSTFFYLMALLAWIGHIQKTTPRKWPYFLSFLSFILSILAKASAVTIPLVLFLLDYYFQRPVSRKTVAEKIPFLLGALGLGIITWLSVEATDAFPATGLFSIPDRLFLSLYAIFLYLRKLLFPVTISCFYPLPVKHGAWFPLPVYLASAAVVLGGWLLWRKRRGIDREVLLGVLFFLIMILPVLHFIKINDSIVYDRFSYLSSLGIFLVMANAYRYLMRNQPFGRLPIDIRKLTRALFPIYLLYLSLFSWQRAHVWRNSLTLWSDVIQQFPKSALAYHNRAHTWTKMGRHDLALKDASKAVGLVPYYVDSRLNRGRIYVITKAYDLALMDFSHAIRLAPENPEGYLERGNMLLYFHRYEPAIRDFTDSLRLNPRQGEAHNNRGNVYLLIGRDDLAMDDYTKALEIDPSYAAAYLNRAMGHLIRRETQPALQDVDAALRLDPLNVLARRQKAEILNQPSTF